ncbi:MAG: tRNA (guanosine(37)-N1)-methyltransferase TrmD [Candidatus Melainabacteria bacterium]|nr:tRNA (guanosine(37)-N1)-methyltransferase TrmD [Candidatus Melainabacteria bacterium]
MTNPLASDVLRLPRLHCYILSLFPEVIHSYTQASIIGRAQKQGILKVDVINPRDFATDAHHRVDDTPYGGGAGMVLMAPPILSALDSIDLGPNQATPGEKTSLLMTSPAGRVFNHDWAKTLAQCDRLVLLCGHYEGFDERILHKRPDIELLSLGDFVMTGGELAALAVVDAVARLIPGVVQKFDSVTADSFYTGILDHPHYTRPAQLDGDAVPDVLLSGHHGAIAQWRRQQALLKTALHRPDLLEQARHNNTVTEAEYLWARQQARLSNTETEAECQNPR